MTDTDPDCVPVKNDGLGQKEGRDLSEHLRNREHLPASAMHAILQSQMCVCVKGYQQVF